MYLILPHGQAVRHWTLTPTCVSSNLTGAAIFLFAEIAQLVEQLPRKEQVVGSNPIFSTIMNININIETDKFVKVKN